MPTTTTILRCSQCPSRIPGTYRLADDADTATCDTCGHAVSLRDDIRPHLDANERTTIHGYAVGGILLRRVAVIRTDACDACGSISTAHFDVRAGDDIPARLIPCPNDTTR